MTNRGTGNEARMLSPTANRKRPTKYRISERARDPIGYSTGHIITQVADQSAQTPAMTAEEPPA